MEASAIVSSSASGMTLETLQKGWIDPSKLILGHRFDPPHLIPLVELTANEKTRPGILDETKRFYHDIGKVPISIKKGMPGHVANRLHAAVWREAVSMAVEGVASVEDIEKAMWVGPRLRGAAVGLLYSFILASATAVCGGFARISGIPATDGGTILATRALMRLYFG